MKIAIKLNPARVYIAYTAFKDIAMEPIIMHYAHLLIHSKVTTRMALSLELMTADGLLEFTELVKFTIMYNNYEIFGAAKNYASLILLDNEKNKRKKKPQIRKSKALISTYGR